MIDPAQRAGLVLTALPFLTLAMAHFLLRRLKLRRGMNLLAAFILMLRQIGRPATGVSALFFACWLAGKYLDPAAAAVYKSEPRTALILMGSAMLAYLYLFVRWCWQIWSLRRKPQESV